MIQQHDLIREARDEIQLVTDEEHCHAFGCQRMQQLEQLHLVRQVQKGRWLIEHERAGLLCQCSRDPRPLPLTARQLVGATTGEFSDACP
jgi:hypothetical protein